MSTQLTESLERNTLLNESQYAYCSNSCTEQTALVNVTEQIYESVVKSEISFQREIEPGIGLITAVMLITSIAFYSVNHYLFLNKHVQLNIYRQHVIPKLFA